MKKLLTVFLVTIFAATSLSAQFATAGKKGNKKMTHCYAMKDGALMRCMGKSKMPQTDMVTLKNGTTINATGEVTMKDGTTKQMEDGQCISMMGKIGDCKKMHGMAKGKMKMKGDKMKSEKMTEDNKM